MTEAASFGNIPHQIIFLTQDKFKQTLELVSALLSPNLASLKMRRNGTIKGMGYANRLFAKNGLEQNFKN